MQKPKSQQMITDYATGRSLPDIGPESNRQATERYLVEKLGYPKNSLTVNEIIEVLADGQPFRSRVDLLVSLPHPDASGGTVRVMAIKCVAGSLGSWEREILAAARLLDGRYQIPFSVISSGNYAHVLDTLTGRLIGTGLEAIPTRKAVRTQLNSMNLKPLSAAHRARQSIIFRAYASMNVNMAIPGE